MPFGSKRLLPSQIRCWPRLALGCLAACLAAVSSRAEDDVSDIPPPLTEYMGRAIAPYMTYHGATWLVREEREREEHCRSMLKALAIKPGQTVCDMGCGNGYYTLKLAKLVGKTGRVLAVDIQPEMLRLLEAWAKEQAIKNVELIQGSVIDPKLPEGKLDLILLADVYHEFSYPEQMLRAMRKALKPDGRLVLVEFRLEDPSVPIKLEHKMSKEQVKKELLPNGYKLVEEFDKLPWQHVMFFQPDDAEEGEGGRRKETGESGK
ncbi:MAG TPA: class I SAM-dependent methyltransferase [Pirellulales bacterium]|nr:class I SAM-dependent methyltransferase [Pirellulales bacterium]